jgi:hypothetical protein
MDAALSRGYAGQLIERMPCAEEFDALIESGMDKKVFRQYEQISYTRKADLVEKKMRRACGGRMRVRIPTWSRNKTSVVLDCVTGHQALPAHNYFNPEHIQWTEKSLVMNTFFCQRTRNRFKMYRMTGPSINQHAISRLLQRGATNIEALRSTCHAALSRSREAVSLLRQEEDVYDLLLPFAQGAIVVQVHGSRDGAQPGIKPPNLSVRTYLKPNMINAEKRERIKDLQQFYCEADWSNTERYASLLIENRRFLGLAEQQQVEEAIPV